MIERASEGAVKTLSFSLSSIYLIYGSLSVFGSSALKEAEVFIIYSPLGGLALFVCTAIEKRIETARLCPRVRFLDLALSLSLIGLSASFLSRRRTDGRRTFRPLSLSPSLRRPISQLCRSDCNRPDFGLHCAPLRGTSTYYVQRGWR